MATQQDGTIAIPLGAPPMMYSPGKIVMPPTGGLRGVGRKRKGKRKLKGGIVAPTDNDGKPIPYDRKTGWYKGRYGISY